MGSRLVLVNENGSGIALENLHHVFFSDFRLTFHDDLVALDRYNFAGILINEVLVPALEHTCSKTLAKIFLKVGLVDLHLFCKVENLKDVLVGLKTDGTQEGSNRQFLLTVDVCIHHIVDVCCKLNP